MIQLASSNRIVADFKIFSSNDVEEWEKVYNETMNDKYKKNTRNYSKVIRGKPITLDNVMDRPPIYLIPRERAGPGYLSVPLERFTNGKIIFDNENVQYCPISKGYPMQDLSSFTLGPVIGGGLCLVNYAFSKTICIAHIEGGGMVDLKRKNFWKRARPERRVREVVLVDDERIRVDKKVYLTVEWLQNNLAVWYPEWNKWRKSVALCSMGDFHWTDSLGADIMFKKGKKYMKFVEWKKTCYIFPAYELLPKVPAFKFLYDIWKRQNIPLGLVHPMANLGEAEKPITKQFIRNLYDSESEMCCMPYVVAGRLMGVEIKLKK